ncbi:Probable phospholipid hydroperoxide glutathione peroxidase [Eumeta japonica]|uniref:Glutathione peroxidase n=1 Tax=Eumeta variegata TaxID=151549 RepID=A0A4C1VWW8_EUMVA|nr:Probable phospholipid hydroperoxide glutathione peroxidase [Eumeta japonica]
MHRVRVRNRASVGATVARRAYSPAPYLCMRIDATRLFGAEIVLGNRTEILAFPCNQFAGQEPGNSEEIVCFMKDRKVKFDMFEKIDVNGDNAHPLWKFLKHKHGGVLGSFIKWNFSKFIIDKNGVPVERHGPNVDPAQLEKHLEKYW